MTTDFRAELQALVDAYDENGGKWPQHHEYGLFIAFKRARATLAEREPEGQFPAEPVAWMYRGEPDFDGTVWRENWEVTTNHRLAVFKAQPNQPVPLVPAAQAVKNDAYEAWYFKHNSRSIAAAALRAAVARIPAHWDAEACIDHLTAIAAELEGTNG